MNNVNPYQTPRTNSKAAHELDQQVLNRDQCPRCAHHADLDKVARSVFGYHCEGCNCKLRLVLPKAFRIAYAAATVIPSLVVLAIWFLYPRSITGIYALSFWTISLGGSSILMGLLAPRYAKLTAK